MDINIVIKNFKDEFDYLKTNKEYIELIKDELDRRTWEAEKIKDSGSNEHCYIFFNDMKTDNIKLLKNYFASQNEIIMDYKEEWNDMKRWLNQGIDCCNKRAEAISDNDVYNELEFDRLIYKASSLRLVLQHMLETEKIFSSIAVSEF